MPEILSDKVLDYKAFGLGKARLLDAKTFDFVANQALKPGQELEVKVTFPTDILNISKPRWQQSNRSNTRALSNLHPQQSDPLEKQS